MALRFALAFCLFSSSPALAWGPEGHEIVAAIAAANLTPAADAQVQALLGPPPAMILESNWADEIRGDRPETATWHYVNVVLESSGYDARRDCSGGNCVVVQIEKDMAVLGNMHAPRNARVEALRFLIHFIGDVHQPLHVADNRDKGGNARRLFFRGADTNLHRIWDTDVVVALGRDPVRVAGSINAGIGARQKDRDGSGAPGDWAGESLAIAKRIYAGLPADDSLPDDYALRQRAIVRQQLEKAGMRLAATLNKVLR